MRSGYNGGLTREQFLFFEMRTTAALLAEGLGKEAALARIKEENLFQFPTERTVGSIANACFKRLEALGTESRGYQNAFCSLEAARQINIYCKMR